VSDTPELLRSSLTHSPTIGAIAAALAKAQGTIRGAAKDAKNPHFNSKYADLASIVDACREPLAANELAVVQSPTSDANIISVETMLLHSSGEWICGRISAQARDASPQAVGSAITYLRRYSLAPMVGVAPDDDDAEAAQPGRETRAKGAGDKKPSPSSSSGADRGASAIPSAPPAIKITDGQRKRLFEIATEHGWKTDEVKALLVARGFKESKDVTDDAYQAICATLREGTAGAASAASSADASPF